MKIDAKNYLVQLAVVVFCGFNAIDILDTWENSIFCRFGWIAFLIWLLPVIVFTISNIGPLKTNYQGMGSAIAVAISVVGVMGSLNILKHIALAVSVAELMPNRWMKMVLMVSAFSWMPALGYFIRADAAHYMLPERSLVAFLGATAVLCGEMIRLRGVSNER